MAKIELSLPAMGEGIIEATITKWLANEGDPVEEDQPLLEIATDKVDSEVPSPSKGILVKIIRAEGETPAIGDVLGVIETEAEQDDPERIEVRREVDRIRDKGRNTSQSGAFIEPDNKLKQSAPAESKTQQKKEYQAKQQPQSFEQPQQQEKPQGNRQLQQIERPETNRQPQSFEQPEQGELQDSGQEVKSDQREGYGSTIPVKTASGKFITPLVRSIAEKENITSAEIDTIKGSGERGRITREDIMQYLENKQRNKKEPEAKPAASGTGDRIIEMDRVRKLIAEHMVKSKQTSAHVTSFIDTDVTDLVKWRDANKGEFEARENQKLTFTPFFIMAAARALRDYPMINISVSGTSIIVKKEINIGMAVALANGKLIVPVIRNADEKNLTGMVRSVNDLAERARDNNLQPNETSGGTFTITNFGTFRNTAGTPIINQPQAAILGTGAITKKPVVIETGGGDVIGIRHIMTLSLSYDHRAIDGALGGMFLSKIAWHLENFKPGQAI